jgi:hypothetical protein
MRVRLFVLCVVLLGAALGAVGCSSSGASSNGKSPVSVPAKGTVTVKSGGKVVCVIKLDAHGTGNCKVNTANYAPGKVTFTGTYSGSSGSANRSTTLTLLPAAKQTT